MVPATLDWALWWLAAKANVVPPAIVTSKSALMTTILVLLVREIGDMLALALALISNGIGIATGSRTNDLPPTEYSWPLTRYLRPTASE
jgi:hypothetical protein